MTREEKVKKLELIAKEVQKCQKCPLYKGTNKAVPGEGDPDAKVFFIGEGPGYNEDITGKPFVGRAGKFLDELIGIAGMRREEVFIGNVVKHRPPENRDPLPNEIEACAPWLDGQLEIIDPPFVVTLGRFSMTKFIYGASISKIHGVPRKVGKRIIMPMYHPAAGLRSPAVAEALKEDFKKLQNLVDGKIEFEGIESGLPPETVKKSNEQMSLL